MKNMITFTIISIIGCAMFFGMMFAQFHTTNAFLKNFANELATLGLMVLIWAFLNICEVIYAALKEKRKKA